MDTSHKPYTLTYLVDQIEITIPPSPKRSRIILFVFWLIPWTGFVLFISLACYQFVGLLINAASNSAKAIWFIYLIIGIIVLFSLLLFIERFGEGLYFFLWHISGEEIIRVTPQAIKIQRSILGIGKLLQYNFAEIRDLQTTRPTQISFAFLKNNVARFKVPAKGPITFRYRKSIIYCGRELDEASAQTIVAAIQQRFPQYKSIDPTISILPERPS